MKNKYDLAWSYLVELRKEMDSAQRLRNQTAGVKISLLGIGFGIAAANEGLRDSTFLFTILAIAAVFFDFLIHGYTASVKRIGAYIGRCLEDKILRGVVDWPEDVPLWEEVMRSRIFAQSYSTFGNLGLTALACLPAIVTHSTQSRIEIMAPSITLILGLLVADWIGFKQVGKLGRDWDGRRIR